MVSCSKFTLLMSIYASYALLLAQAEDLKRSGSAKDQVENIRRHLRNTVTIREELDDLFPHDSGDRERLDNSIVQSRRAIREEIEQERRSVTGSAQSERLADNRRESTRYGSIERPFDRQIERLEDREDRTRSIEENERISTDRQVGRLEDREDRGRSTDRQVERLEDRIRSIEDSETRTFDRRESRRESREELSEPRVTSRRESRDLSRREVTREDRVEYRSEDRESRQDSRGKVTSRLDEDNVRMERSLGRTLTESERKETDRKVRREEIRDSRLTGSKVDLVERNVQLSTFLGQMVSLIVTAMLVNKSIKGGFNSKLKHLFSNKITVK